MGILSDVETFFTKDLLLCKENLFVTTLKDGINISSNHSNGKSLIHCNMLKREYFTEIDCSRVCFLKRVAYTFQTGRYITLISSLQMILGTLNVIVGLCKDTCTYLQQISRKIRKTKCRYLQVTKLRVHLFVYFSLTFTKGYTHFFQYTISLLVLYLIFIVTIYNKTINI